MNILLLLAPLPTDLQVAVTCSLKLTTLLDNKVKFRAISLNLHAALKAAVTLLDLNGIYVSYIPHFILLY